MIPKEVTIYTDGACIGNPGPGGYGAVLLYGKHRKELSGGFRLTTNNRIEILAAVEALKALKHPCKVTLYSDSQYLVHAISKNWLSKWQSRNWRKYNKQPVLNVDLLQEMLEQLNKHQVTFHWVKGHNGIPENERCDALAMAAAQQPGLPPDMAYEQSKSRPTG